METAEKQKILAEYLNRFRKWKYETLSAEIDRTRARHDCLATFSGVAADGSEYHLEFNVFWDDVEGGNVRVCGDITVAPQSLVRRVLPVHTPDVTDSFILSSDGKFVGE